MAIWRFIFLLLSATVTTISSATVLCSVRNRDPCVNFPDLCTANGAICVVMGPCEYQCVCPPDSNVCTGTPLTAPVSGDVRPVETESLLVFSPNLFEEFQPANRALVSPTVANVTTALSPGAASFQTGAADDTTIQMTSEEPTTSTPATSTAPPVALAAVVERRVAMKKPFAQTASTQTTINSITTESLSASNFSDVFALASSTQSTQTAQSDTATSVSTAKTIKTSSKQDIHQILENIKSSFQQLTSHIFGADNRSVSTPTITPIYSSTVNVMKIETASTPISFTSTTFSTTPSTLKSP